MDITVRLTAAEADLLKDLIQPVNEDHQRLYKPEFVELADGILGKLLDAEDDALGRPHAALD